MFRHHADAETKILPGLSEPIQAAFITIRLLYLLNATELKLRRALGGLRRQAGRHVGRRRHLQMDAKLLRKLRFNPMARPKWLEPEQESTRPGAHDLVRFADSQTHHRWTQIDTNG